METKVYITQKKHTLADGTVKYYPNSSKYTPKRKEIHRTEIYKRVHNCNTETLMKIKEILDDIEKNQNRADAVRKDNV